MSAQGPPEDVTLGIERFDVGDGLPGLFVTDLAVADDGRLWMLSSGRLTSFDGLVFEEHEIAGAEDWRGGSLVGIGTGRADTVWVTSGPRLFSYVSGTAHEHATHDIILRDVWEDAEGVKWCWDDEGLLRVSDGRFERILRLGRGWNRGPLPVGGAVPQRWIHDPVPGTLRRVNAGWFADSIAAMAVWPFATDRDRALVTLGRADSTVATGLDGSVLAGPLAVARPNVMLVDRRGLLWRDRGGFVEALDEGGRVVASLPTAEGARITSAIEDREGGLWLGTVTDGLFRVARRPVRVVGAEAGLTDGQVARISEGGSGAVLVVSERGDVKRFQPSGRVDTLFLASPETGVVEAAVADRRGTVWLSVRPPEGSAFLVGLPPEGPNIEIPLGFSPPHQIVEDPREAGLLWLGGGNAVRVRPYAPGGPEVGERLLPPAWGGRDFAFDPEGALWAVGSGGLVRIVGDSIDTFEVGSGRAVHSSSDGTIWIGRYYGGLVRYRDGEFREIRTADGLWDDVVSAILEDDAGNLWMSSNRGVHRVSVQAVEAFLDGRETSVYGMGYGPDAGFRNPEASGWYGHRSTDGRLWFPTFSGAAVIDPEAALALEQVPPGVRMRGIGAGGARISPDSIAAIARGVRHIEVDYGAILLSGHLGVRYEVMLDGVDPGWVDAGSQRSVAYGNLPPGRRRFRARAVSGAGVRSTSEASVLISVPPFFRETGSFRLLMTMALVGALWLVYHLRVRQLRAREITLVGLVDERTRALATSQRATEAALVTVQAQAEELQSLDEAKSRFFANVSHELRTPLTLVQGPLQDVLDGRLGPTSEPVREQVGLVLASGRRLGELVEQLLDVARLEAGEMRLHVRDQDLEPLLTRLASSFAALARSRGIDFDSRMPEGPVFARVDADQLEKVYGNLLGNAVKFSVEGGRVGFGVQVLEGAAGRELVVRVDDDGPGIPEEEHQRIFERFQQVDDSSRRRHGGTGLGLALVKEVVELHGGRIELESAPGRGSCFTVRLPIVGAEDAPAAELTALPVAHAESDDVAPRPAVLDVEVPGEETGPDAEQPTVLVVEDNAELRAYLRRHLDDDYRVVEAGNGREGLAEARRSVPDLILCDLMMPEMDGDELCRAVRADPELSYLPVIMVTARASRSSRLKTLDGGADDYLVKPFDPEELRLRIRNALAARRRLRERLEALGSPPEVRAIEIEGRSGPANGDARFMADLEAALREHMADEDFDVGGLAKALSMSRATLYRKAREALGQSPMELLWSFRLRQAAQWLGETDGTVSEVAYACGFKTVPHFTRRFKARFGATPAAFRDG